MRRLRMLVGAGSAAFVLSTCGDAGPEQPGAPAGQAGPGWITVTLTTNETDAGGVLMTIRGGPVDSVRSSYPHVFDKAVGPLQKVAVVGDIVAGTIAELAGYDKVRREVRYGLENSRIDFLLETADRHRPAHVGAEFKSPFG